MGKNNLPLRRKSNSLCSRWKRDWWFSFVAACPVECEAYSTGAKQVSPGRSLFNRGASSELNERAVNFQLLLDIEINA